jgi:ParB family chromosome partitioning protein
MASKSKQHRKTNGHADAPPVNVRQSINVPFNMLGLSQDNVRNIYDKARITLLAESIARVGLLQSLSVQPVLQDGNDTGRFSVIGGGRRFRALEQLVTGGRLPADHPIPCVPSDGMAADISLVENAEREALHPLDEFRAFKAMIDAGGQIEATAAAYRVTPTYVKQRMRMAAASPKVLKAYEDDVIDLDQLMEFCATENHKRQETVLKGLKSGSINGYHNHIKRAVTEDTVSANDRRARFIGVDDYQKAGGAVAPDLFGDENHVFLTDTDLVAQMVDDKLAAIRDAELAKGWKWAIAAPAIDYGEKNAMDELMPIDLTDEEQQHVTKLEEEAAALEELDQPTKKQQKRLEAVQAELEAIENRPPTFSAEDMARAGVFITLDHNGEVDIDYGYIRPEDQVSEHPADDDGELVTNAIHANGSSSEDTEDDSGDAMKPLSETLVNNLTAHVTVGMRNALANNFPVAFLAMLHAMVANRFYNRSTLSCLQITTTAEFASNTPGLDSWPATKQHDARHAAWKTRLPKDEKDLWAFLSDMEETDRQALFAHCAANTLNAVKGRGQFGYNRDTQVTNAHQVAAALDFSMVQAGWVTGAENYFLRVSKQHILAAVTEAAGADKADLISHMKKAGMATEAERLVKETGWLPEVMRTATAEVAHSDDEPAAEVPAFLQNTTNMEETAAA